jgi:glyoxylase-like metal-dependent hydrolase (beta-lactamase superfamily II)
MPTAHVLELDYLGEPRRIAAFLVKGPRGAALVETGPASTTPALERALAAHGVSVADIRHALLTHIHLDHAGAAGWLARRAGATLHVHEFGARHLIDPSKLKASAERIYGEDMQRLWGTIEPAPAESVAPLRDGDVVDACGAVFRAIETPGHARHHHAFALDTDEGRACFVGDVAAMVRPARASGEGLVLDIPTPPPEFDLELWRTSLERLEAEQFDALYLTHFGCIAGRQAATAHLRSVRAMLESHAAFVRDALDEGIDEPDIVPRYGAWVRTQALAAGHEPGNRLTRWASDAALASNVTGMVRYWRSR